MARRFAARGHEVHVVSATSDPHQPKFESLDGFTLHWLFVPYSQHMSYKERIRSFIAFAAHAATKARSLRGDVVFATSTPLTVAIPGIYSTIFTRRPLVFEVRDLWPDVPIAMGALNNKLARTAARFLERAVYRYSAHIIALSPDMEKRIIDKGITPDKISTVPNASDNELFANSLEQGVAFRHRHHWLGPRKLVLYCGTVGVLNDVSYIARLAAATHRIDKSIRFVVLGTGNDEERVKKTAQNLGVYGKNFFMLKKIPKTEVPGVFAAADISMSTVAPIPILAANSANKVFDTFASGTPLAINHEGWIANLLRSSKAGIVLSPLDLESASIQLTQFLSDPSKIQAASSNAKSLASHRFDRDLLTNRVAEILEDAYKNR